MTDTSEGAPQPAKRARKTGGAGPARPARRRKADQAPATDNAIAARLPVVPSDEAAGTAALGAGSVRDRHAWIAEAAYRRAAGRGFAPGKELEDWLAAEADYEAQQRG